MKLPLRLKLRLCPNTILNQRFSNQTYRAKFMYELKKNLLKYLTCHVSALTVDRTGNSTENGIALSSSDQVGLALANVENLDPANIVPDDTLEPQPWETIPVRVPTPGESME